MEFPGVSQAQIEEKLVTESYKNYSILIVGDFFAAVLFAFILWDKVSTPRFVAIWLLLMFAVNHLLRGLFVLKYHQLIKQGNLRHGRFWKNFLY